MNNTNDIINSLQGEFKNIQRIESQLFTALDHRPRNHSLTHVIPNQDGINFETPDHCEVYAIRKDTAQHLGTVKGSTYESIQPQAFLDSIMNSISECNVSLDLSKLKYSERKNGKVIEFRQPTDTIVFRNRAKKTEEIGTFLNFETGFGGFGRTEIGLYTTRFICSNGMRIVDAEIELFAKHTENMNIKALMFCDEIYKQLEIVQTTSAKWQAMDKITVSNADIKKFKATLLNNTAKTVLNNPETNALTKKGHQLNRLHEAFEVEMSRTGKSVYGMLQGATYFTNHLAMIKDTDEEYILSGSGAKMNATAQRLAMAYL